MILDIYVYILNCICFVCDKIVGCIYWLVIEEILVYVSFWGVLVVSVIVLFVGFVNFFLVLFRVLFVNDRYKYVKFCCFYDFFFEKVIFFYEVM